MAERNRPGDDAAGDRPGDESTDDVAAYDADSPKEPVTVGGGTSLTESDETAGDEAAGRSAKVKKKRGPGRIGGFFREVVSELRKVIWPTRKELLTYTGVVIAFVTVMTTIVALLDYGFGKAILATFGN